MLSYVRAKFINAEFRIAEIIDGVDGEPATYRQRRDGDYLIVYGETGDGRLLTLAGEFLGDGRFRVFHAMDMDDAAKRRYRRGK